MTGMDDLIHALEAERVREVPSFRAGDIVRFYEKVSEGARERLQPFEGVVLKVSGSGTRTMMTVRKIAAGVGVERTVPVHSPNLDRIEVIKHNTVTKSRPYWLRRVGRIHKIE